MLPLSLNNLLKHLQTPLSKELTKKYEKSQIFLNWAVPLKGFQTENFYKHFVVEMLRILEQRPMKQREVLLESYEYPNEIIFPMKSTVYIGYMYLTTNVEPSKEVEGAADEISDNNNSNISNSHNNS